MDESNQIHTRRNGEESSILISFLAYARAVATAKVIGLDEEMVRREMTPSHLSAGGVVKHLASVESWWFSSVFLGDEIEPVRNSEGRDEFRVEPGTSVDELLASYANACRQSDEIVHSHDLDELSQLSPDGDRVSLRWIVLHIIEETSRHNGHLDLMREMLDGRTGEF